MPLTTLSKMLDWLVKFLVVCISTWIIFYAFDRPLYHWMGEGLYVMTYNWISRFISLGVVLLFVTAVWYALKVQSDNKK